MTPEFLAKLEEMHATVAPAAPAEIYQQFPELAETLRAAWRERDEALAEVKHLRAEHDFWKEEAFDKLRLLNEVRAQVREARELLSLILEVNALGSFAYERGDDKESIAEACRRVAGKEAL